MDYKELLNRYKKGLASEEEKKIVEEELKKQEAFEEYTSEIFDEELDSMTEPPSMDMHNEETSKLKKNVNKRLRKVVLASVLAVVALYFIVFYVISGIVDRAYYDPTAVSQSEGEENPLADFHFDMQSHISLNIPGYSLYAITLQDSEGFGNYQVIYTMKNLFTGNEEPYSREISRGELTYRSEGVSSSENRFATSEGFKIITWAFEKLSSLKSYEIQKNNEETIRYLKELNPLSYISMNIVFNEDLSMEEFYKLKSEHLSLDFKWLGIRTVEPGTSWSENQPLHLIGFNPNPDDETFFNLRPDSKKYPVFYLSDKSDSIKVLGRDYSEVVSEAYEIHFKSRLEYLRDRESFLKIFDYNQFPTDKIDFYNHASAYIDKNGVKTYGVLVYGTAADFLENIDKIPYDSIYIKEVLAAKPDIYNN